MIPSVIWAAEPCHLCSTRTADFSLLGPVHVQARTTFSLSDLIAVVPPLFGHIPSASLTALRATSKGLCNQVQASVTRIRIGRQEDPCLRYSSLTHLTAARWNLLENLDLHGTPLSAADIIQLSTGIWPHLKYLSLESEDLHTIEDSSGVKRVMQVDQVDSAFKQSIQRAHWPKVTHLFAYGFGGHAFNMTWLVSCSWLQLGCLDLSGLPLWEAACELLTWSHWPCLQELQLGSTELGMSSGLQHLVNAHWSSLQYLDLWDCDLSNDEMVELAKGQWPLLEKLCLHKNGMGLEGMTALVKADWPLLRMLDVSCYDHGGDDDTITTLMSGNWPALECLEVPETADQELLCPEYAEVSYSRNADTFEHVASVQWPNLKTIICSDAMSMSECMCLR